MPSMFIASLLKIIVGENFSAQKLGKIVDNASITWFFGSGFRKKKVYKCDWFFNYLDQT